MKTCRVKKTMTLFWLCLLSVYITQRHSNAVPLDTLVFGSSTSETSHTFISNYSQTYTGSASQTARQLLPKSPADIYGGDMTFTMSVDAIKQNYFTIKISGDESANGDRTLLHCEGYEIGFRHSGDQDDLYDTYGAALPGRFIFRTVRLPLWLTRGKSKVTLQIVSTGYIAPYDTATYTNYQKVMTAASRGYYKAYTHTDSYFDPPSGEALGTAPAAPPVRPTPGEEVIANIETRTNTYVNNKLNSSTMNAVNDIEFLALSYHVTWSSGYHNSAIVNRVIQDMDAQVANYNANPGIIGSSWGGYFGPVGNAIRLLYTQLQPSLSTVISVGDPAGALPRSKAWSHALRASVDSGRFGRKSIGNQVITCDLNIYKANKALELIDSSNALPESQAMRYLYEATGAQPYLGSDLIGGGSVEPFGPSYYMVTAKGDTREPGWVGSDYGEQVAPLVEMWKESGDATIKQRAIAMLQARAHFRYPGLESGAYKAMLVSDMINCRNIYYPGRVFYSDMSAAAAFGETHAVGYAKQWIADNQYLNYVANATSLTIPDDYATVKALADPGLRLPMTDNQPDFAWADEGVGVLTVKHGTDRLFASLYWKSPGSINGLARLYLTTPQTDRIVEMHMDDVQFDTAGDWNTGDGLVDWSSLNPPDNPINSNYGIHELVSNNVGGGGLATAYTLRYGHYLIGMNCSGSQSYQLKVPSDFTSAVDLVSGQTLTAPISIGPMSTVVFYLSALGETSPSVPATPLYLNSLGSHGVAQLSWYPSAGATKFNVKRASVSGGPYTTMATGLTGAVYTDGSVSNGTTYYYVVSSTNANGESANSPEISVTTTNSSLAAPWSNSDVGSVGVAGSISLASGIYTIKASGADIYGSSDSFHYAYQPISGDFTITARVASQQGGKVGVMVRQSLASNSMYMDMVLNGGASKVERRYDNGNSASNPGRGSGGSLYWVRLVRIGNTITGYVSPDGNTWTMVGTPQVDINFDSTVYAGLCVCGQNNSVLTTATFDNVSINRWFDTDIGAVGVAGSATTSAGTMTIQGAGTDIWGTADAFHYVYQAILGDCTIVAHVASQQGGKAGIIIRQSFAPGAPYVDMVLHKNFGTKFEYRTNPSGSAGNSGNGSGTAPYWVKLTHTGSVFTGYTSPNGATWTQIGQTTNANLALGAYVGLGVTSQNNTTLTTSAFDSISISTP